MSVSLYFDENVHGIIIDALQQRGIDLLRAQDDGFAATPDDRVFQRAIDLNRILVSQDTDMLILAHQFLKTGHPFTGLLFLKISDLHNHIESLTYIAQSATPEELANSVWFLPL